MGQLSVTEINGADNLIQLLSKELSAFGFLTDHLLLFQWEDRTMLLDLEKDMLFYPSLKGRLLLCQEGAALFVEDDRVDCWQLA